MSPPVAIVHSCLGEEHRVRICKHLGSPEIDSKDLIPAGWESIPGLINGLQIRAQLLLPHKQTEFKISTIETALVY
jgi:hypothetical protein